MRLSDLMQTVFMLASLIMKLSSLINVSISAAVIQFVLSCDLNRKYYECSALLCCLLVS